MLAVSVKGQQSVKREKINFNNDWKFHFGDAADATKDFNYSIVTIFSKTGKGEGTAIDAAFNDSNWRSLQLPHDWAVELPFIQSANADVVVHGFKPVGGLFPETSIGWYRKHFKLDAGDSGKRISIQFDGIFRNAKLWVNGFYLGNNQSGYIGTSYDITDYVNFTGDNVIAVRVDATQYEGWFYEGAGIYRNAWLLKYNNLHVDHNGVYVHTDVHGRSADVHIETTVLNDDLYPHSAELETWITDRNGNKITSVKTLPLRLAAKQKKVFSQIIQIVNPKLWSTGDPYLYRVQTRIKSGSKNLDSIQNRIGIRTIRFDAARGFFLNGQPVKLLGVNCHQDHAGLGSALPDYLQYYRIRLLKDFGANAYRTSHNPPAPELLDACDSLGMLVLDENRLLNSSPEYIDQFERMIARDRNHPSVILWSIGNEEALVQTNGNGKRIAQTLIAKQKESDSSRTSIYAADLANVYRGINEVIPVRGFNYRQTAVDDYHKDHPGQPIIGTEMGSTVTTRGIYTKDSVKGYVPDEDLIAPWWASTAEAWWPLAADHAYWLGGFLWAGFDYRGEPTPYEWPNINSHFGVMDICGFPKNIYYYYQSWWTDKDVLHISPHWNWQGKEGQPIDVWVNSNADHVELFLNGRSLGKKEMKRNSHLQWSVNYEQGKLEAVAFKKGRRLTNKIETTGKPDEMIITPSKTTLLADGRDATVVNISVVDKQGREVPDADNLIRFDLQGDGQIIGVGNGDPSSHEPDKCENGKWQRHLFNGRCQVILRSGNHPDMLRFEASTAQINTSSTTLVTIQPQVSPLAVSQTGSAGKQRVKSTGKIIGADISFLPELENKGMVFSDSGKQKDALTILKAHGFNYIRLRLFNAPAHDSGYSPGKGFCDLAHTKEMAKRIKSAGMKFLLDFHYSDTWADPQHQNKPAAWGNQQVAALTGSVYEYTKSVIRELQAQGTEPDMVQIGNEINHGILWPDAGINNLDNLAQILNAAIRAVNETAPRIEIMMHIALGGQNDEARFFLDNMLARGVRFDVIGLSYYPQWHGTPEDLENNMSDLSVRYKKDIIVVEYSQRKKQVHDLVFNLADGRGRGTFIWEPLNTWETLFEKDGKSNGLIEIYDEIKKQYRIK